MRLSSELYRNILIIHVSQFLSPKSIEILNQNFTRLENIKVEFVFVDLTHAMVPDDVLVLARSTKPQRHFVGLKGIYYIGELPGLSEYRTLEQALRACPAIEASLVRDKMNLEAEINRLKVKQFELEKEQTDATIIRSQVHKLSTENRQLKRFKESMLKEIEASERTGKILEKKKPDADLLKEIIAVKAELLKMAGDLGVK